MKPTSGMLLSTARPSSFWSASLQAALPVKEAHLYEELDRNPVPNELHLMNLKSCCVIQTSELRKLGSVLVLLMIYLLRL